MSKFFDQFTALLRRGNFLILDTETTGLHRGEICQIAIIDDAGKLLMHEYVKPVNGIPDDAMRIHGITNQMVADAPGWAQIAPKVREIVTGRDVVIYNAVYDRKMMHQSAEACGIEKVDWKELANFWCAMEAYAEWYGDWNDYFKNYRYQKLTDAAQRFGVNTLEAHSALADCLMTLSVIKALADEKN